MRYHKNDSRYNDICYYLFSRYSIFLQGAKKIVHGIPKLRSKIQAIMIILYIVFYFHNVCANYRKKLLQFIFFCQEKINLIASSITYFSYVI